MAGVPAGRLSIEIVAEIARLQADLDKAKRAVNAASKDIASSAKYANDNLAGMAGGIGKAGNQSKLAAHHVQNLAFQFQDMAVGLYSGQKPLTVFLQQGSQIAGIMTQAGIGVGGLVRNVASMAAGFVVANPLLIAAGVIAGTVAAAIGLMSEEINKNSSIQVTWMDTLLGTFDAIKAGISEKVVAAFEAMGLDIGAVWESVKSYTKAAINAVIGWVVVVPKLIADTYDKIPAAFGDAFYSAANLAIQALNWLIEKAAAGVNALVDGLNGVFGTKIAHVAFEGFEPLGNKFQGSMAALGKAGAKSLSQSFGRDWLGDAAGAVSPFAQARARARLEADAEKAGKAAGKKAGAAAGKAMADEMAMSFEEAFKEFELPDEVKTIWGNTAAIQKQIDAIKLEAKAVGLEGWERERLLLILNATADIKQLQAQRDSTNNADVAEALKGEIAARQELLRLQLNTGKAEEDWRKAADAARDYDNSLQDIISSLQQIGGFGGVIGGLLGILSGNTGAVRGPVGDLLNLGVTDPTTKEVKKLGDIIKDSLGDLGKDLGGVFQSVGQGIVAASAVTSAERGLGIKTSGGGAQIGGTIGGIAAGPVGAAAGAVAGAIVEKVPFLGGLLGMLAFGGTKRGSAILTGGGVSGYYGNNAGFKEQAGGLGGNVMEALSGIASQLGGTLNTSTGKVSIGVRDGKYYVDPQGRGYTKASKYSDIMSFGDDQEAAVKAAIKNLIDDGVLSGLREGSLKLIQNAKDVEDGIAKAIQFDAIMDELEGGSSQLVQQVKALRSQFDGMIDVMREAGASVADLTRAQELQQQRINDLIAQAGSNYRSTFYTDSQNTSFAQQQIHAVLDPLGKGAIDTVAEYMAEVERAQKDTSDAGLAYLDTLYSLADAFGVLKEASDAAAAAKQAEAAQNAADAAQARANAENALRQAYSRDSGALQQTIDKFNGLTDTLASFRKEILAGDNATASYAMRLAELRRVGALAGMGDEGALGALPGVGQDFLSAAKNRAGSAVEYQRAVALVARYASTAEQASRGMATEAQKQLDAINKQVGALIDLTDGVLSLTDAIKQFTGAGVSSSSASAKSAHREELLQQRDARREQRLLDRAARLQDFRDRREPTNDNQSTSNAQIEERLAAQEAALTSLARNSAEQTAFFKRLSPDGLGLRVVTDGVPLEVAS